MQGGLISARVVVERPDIFVGLILSAPPVLYQPPYFGSILVNHCTDTKKNVYVIMVVVVVGGGGGGGGGGGLVKLLTLHQLCFFAVEIRCERACICSAKNPCVAMGY